MMAFMSVKENLGNGGLLHMYLVVAKMEVKFGKELSTTQFIQNVINDGNGSLMVILLCDQKSRNMCQVPSFLITMTIGEE
jgi:hypothetical protein